MMKYISHCQGMKDNNQIMIQNEENGVGTVLIRSELFSSSTTPAYSKQWWREYLQIRNSHSNRLVKIFAQDENSEHHFVCSFVKPLRSGRLLESPTHAAR